MAIEINNQNSDEDIIDNRMNNDDEMDFLKQKHKSDQSYLNKLNQIVNTSELKTENGDYNLFNIRNSAGRRNNVSSRDHHSSFLYSPSQSSVNSDRNNSRITNYSPVFNRSSSSVRTMPNIPPAIPNMEVVVGKGRRVNSAMSRTKIGIPPSGQNTSSRPKTASNSSSNLKENFMCEKCSKKYDNIKDLDIHRLYCNPNKI
jgi:hypothetical protein